MNHNNCERLIIPASTLKRLSEKSDLEDAGSREKSRNGDVAFKQYLQEESQKLRQKWFVSKEDIYKKIIKDKASAKAIREAQLAASYKLIKSEQEEERQLFLAEVQERIFKSQEYPRRLSSACLLSDVIYERDRQVEFKRANERRLNELDRLQDEKCRKYTETIEKREEAKIRSLKEKQYEWKRAYEKLLRDNGERRKSEEKKSFDEEKAAVENALERLQLENGHELKKKSQHSKRLHLLSVQDIEDKRKYRDQQNSIDKEDEMFARIFSEAKYKMNQMILNKERIEAKQKSNRSNFVAKNFLQNTDAYKKYDQTQMENAIKEIEARESKKLCDQKARDDLLRLQRINDHNNWEKSQLDYSRCNSLQRTHEDEQRRKLEEITGEFAENTKVETKNHILEYREKLLAQISEINERNVSQRKKEITLYNELLQKLKNEDEKFISYATDVIQGLHDRKRLTFPALRVLHEFKKTHGYFHSNKRNSESNRVEKEKKYF